MSLPLRIISSNSNDDYNKIKSTSLSPLKSTTRSSIVPPIKPSKITSSSLPSSSKDNDVSEEDKIISQYYKQKIDPQQSFLQDKSFQKLVKTIELIKELSIHSASIFQSLIDDVTNINNKITKLSNDCVRVSKLCNDADNMSAIYSNSYSNVRSTKNHDININNKTATNQLLPESIPSCIKQKYLTITQTTNFDTVDSILNIEKGQTSKKLSDPQLFFRKWKENQEKKIKMIQNLRKNNNTKTKKKKKVAPKRTSTFMSIFRSMTETNKTDIKIDNIEKMLQTESFFKVDIVVPEKIVPQTPPPKAKRPSQLQSSPTPTTNPSSPIPNPTPTSPIPPPPPPPPFPNTKSMSPTPLPPPPPPPPPAYPNPNKITQKAPAPPPPIKPPRRQSTLDSESPRKDSIDSDSTSRKDSVDEDEIKASTEKSNVGQIIIANNENIDVKHSFELDKTIETRISISTSLLDSIKSSRTEIKTPPLTPNKDKVNIKEDIFEQIRRGGSMLKKVDASHRVETKRVSSVGIFDNAVVAELLARRSYLEQEQSDEDDDDDEWD